MKILQNTYRGHGIDALSKMIEEPLSSDITSVLMLLNSCPIAKATPLVNVSSLAQKLGVASIHIKDERTRMGLGSFKALGGAYSIAKAAVKANGGLGTVEEMAVALNGHVFVTASAGNHGLSVAAGARVFGARAIVYLSETVPAGFADKLRSFGADVVIEGANYEESADAAQNTANDKGWTLIADSTWGGYYGGRDIMEGYLAMPAEAADQMGGIVPTHVFLQAGVGGLAGAVAVHVRETWGDVPHICIVEPSYAAALYKGIEQGDVVHAGGPVSNMGRLDCKEASLLALEFLAKAADSFMLLEDDFVFNEIKCLAGFNLETSPSGGAGYAGLAAAANANELGIGPDSRILLFLSEGPADD
ncbi:pyridoxal-phosphate dependent enzyme [Amylibacter sp. SFDW26]|uniref:pyridoxal-phosphate dependent enzyme n=1 Tax=Amylibacter sp. SFDW26 TaxID=2652722 RepID=UPI0012614577|nr:pyridoxal-phosphate dependent enzyme [Amylibacter sp. SFDW26]KAB7610387.1 pyridoxal-phosphate dependent enzyme [Amylibacter sp. SFDW26]